MRHRKQSCGAALAAACGIALLTLVLPMLAGCNTAAGPSNDRGSTAATAEQARRRQPAEEMKKMSVSELSDEMIGETVAVEGEVTQQCPAIGCWMIVKDSTGDVFIDLKPASLELSEKHEGEQARVAGRVIKQGGQLQLEAQSIEFSEPERGSPRRN